ncbi:MAG TPA: 50S ribosomal protein L24, partial [Ktedonobacteraceae bacterium]|nr:50S ribosomal protein L24 [Ktedonobacteraceae bacterium]
MNIKKGDTVLIIAGKDKGKQGTVSRALPQVSKVIVEGLNIA